MAFPVEEKFIEIAEAELGARFPESFRNKMMKLNGGCVQFPNKDEVDEDEVGYYELNPFYDTSDKKRIKKPVIVSFMKQKHIVTITDCLKT